MSYFTTKQSFLLYDYTSIVEQLSKNNEFLVFLENSGVSKFITDIHQEIGRPAINPFNLFACIIYGFAFKNSSLRDLESAYKYDLRFMYIMDNQTPSYVTISTFINQVIKPNHKEIFTCLTTAIFKYCELSMDDCYLDGT